MKGTTMHRELLAQSPLLALPLAAMFLFLAVWVVASVRALTRSRRETDEAARLPLDDAPAPVQVREEGKRP
ncbi:MAG: hypothetical protein ACRELB_23645 [Polyangiaceae bacterium]